MDNWCILEFVKSVYFWGCPPWGCTVYMWTCHHMPSSVCKERGRWYHPLHKKYNYSLAPGRFQFHFSEVILKLTLVNGGWGVSYEIALRWMPQDLADDKSTLVQVMAWCRQAASHYLSQCWPRSMSPNDVTRPLWANDNTWPFWSQNQLIMFFYAFCMTTFSSNISNANNTKNITDSPRGPFYLTLLYV